MRSGNSMTIVIPSKWVRALRIEVGSYVGLEMIERDCFSVKLPWPDVKAVRDFNPAGGGDTGNNKKV